MMLLRWTFAAILAAAVAAGQSLTGTIEGIVHDASGAPIPDAKVTIGPAGTDSPRETSTDVSGSFKLSGLPPASYDIVVTKEGFRPLRQSEVVVKPDAALNLSLQLEIGSVTEALEVTARSGDIVTDDRTLDDSLFAVMELAEIIQENREVLDLAYLRSGVGRRASGGLGSGFVVGGARADNTNYILDGFSDYDPRTGGAQVSPNYDAVEEFRVQTTGNTAEYGRLAGGVMDMVLRSGTNRYHGSLFEFFRPAPLGARNFFDQQKSDIERNQFGATFGGPLTLPHYRGNDRTFFLLSWEGLIQSAGQNSLTNVPTALQRAGDFSASGIKLLDPLNGNTPFPGNRIPQNRLDPVGQKIMAYYPLPNRTDPSTNYQVNLDNEARWNSVIFKVDERASEKDNLSFRFVTRISSSTAPFTGSELGLFGSDSHNRPTLAGLNYSHVFGPTLVNEFRAGFVRTAFHQNGEFAAQDMNAQLGLPTVANPQLYGFPRFTLLNLASVGDAASLPYQFVVNNYEAADSVSWTRGHHILKAGVDYLRGQFFQSLSSNTRGTYNFLGRWSNSAAADLLLGLPDSTTRQSSAQPAYLFSSDWGAFVQDQYEVTPRLTLNYGLRYELMVPPHEKYGRISSFVPELGKVVIGDARTVPNLAQEVAAAGLTGLVTTAAQAGMPQSLVYANHLDFAPRFGFALRPFRDSKIVIRGGYGLYYAESLLDPIRNDLTNVYPFSVSQTFNRVTNRPAALTLADPFPTSLATLPGVTNVNGFSSHPRPQYLQSYTFSVERQLDSSTTIEVDFLGSRGSHLGQRYDLNQPFRSRAWQQPNGTFPRLFAAFGTINYYSFGANSVYNEGSVTLRRRFSRGLYYGVSYIYSKGIDDASQISGASAGDYPGVQDSRDLAAERGRADWDTGHSFLFYGSYALPAKGNWLRRGWQVATTARLYTGQPFTPRVANANLTLGEANRPNRIAKGSLADPTVSRWFDVSAFPVVPPGAFQFGNSGRNVLGGPGSITLNVALMRNIRVSERVRLQGRCEAINVLNHANLGLPVDYVDAPNAGQILSADPGRAIQFGVRLQF
jgi:hypothetical protein